MWNKIVAGVKVIQTNQAWEGRLMNSNKFSTLGFLFCFYTMWPQLFYSVFLALKWDFFFNCDVEQQSYYFKRDAIQQYFASATHFDWQKFCGTLWDFVEAIICLQSYKHLITGNVLAWVHWVHKLLFYLRIARARVLSHSL